MAGVKGRLGARKPETEPAPPTSEKRVRAILPSFRVAEFRIPRVRDAMAIREDALAECSVDPTKIKEDDEAAARALVRVSTAMERIALRRLLVGVTDHPAEIVYQPGFNVEATRKQLEADKVEDVDAALVAAMSAAVDEVATAKGARIRPLTDLDWDDALAGGADAGPFALLLNAYEGTDEALDWQNLSNFAGRLISGIKALGAASDAPKARLLQPIRRSAGFVT